MLSTAALASLLLFSGSAIAQIKAPDCTLSWNWTFNTLGQSACTVAAYLLSTCHGGSFTLDPLQPGHPYSGPSGVDNGDLCKCNTVTYSLLSACDACQQEAWIPFSRYVWNCTTVLPPSSFPNPIPSGTRLPQWTLLDVTSENNWNANKSFTVGDSPEIGPGTALSPLGGSGIGPKGTTSPSSSPTSSHSEGGSHTGAIVGGVIGGTVAIAIVGIATFYLRWRRRQAASATRRSTMTMHRSMSRPRLS
ncbi:hypothetical protein BC826DRAFT_165519 [Russula brevipes]|nr:hypothetical protein BC826DRAFT_165519 [Russula brevipes]